MDFGVSVDQSLSKEEKYAQILPMVKAVVGAETNLIANLANIAAIFKYNFHFHWFGFYIKEGNGLVLGPFQGPMACTRIAKSKGVCGAVVDQKASLTVPDVNKFDAHIACSAVTQSEIVVPVIKGHDVIMVIDVDSEHLDHFDSTDQKHLEELALIIASLD